MKSKTFVLSILFLFLTASFFTSCDVDEQNNLDSENSEKEVQLIDRDKVESPATNK